jgi:hypothetical protein
MMEVSWAKKLTKSGLNRTCAICQETPARGQQMHHVKTIREL